MKENINEDRLSISPLGIFKKIKENLNASDKPNILIIGDIPLDVYWICNISQKNFHQKHTESIDQAQYDVIQEIKRPGSVYASARLLKGLGFSVTVITCLGNDDIGKYIRSEHEKIGINLIAPIIEGASFQRHYILCDSTGSFNGQINHVQRINHEPAFTNRELINNHYIESLSVEIEEVIIKSNYILINDTHKGTLTWNDWREPTRGIQKGFIYPCFKELIKNHLKEITILDSRKSMEFYRDLNVFCLTSSAYETAVSLGSSRDELSIPEGGGYFLDNNQMDKLFKEYPDIENWALTRGSQGVQIGLKNKEEGTMSCSNFPAFVDPGNSVSFTPHCGDFFNVGLLYGLSSGLELHESVAFGSMLGALQANKSYAEVLTAEEIFDFFDNKKEGFKDKIYLENLVTLKG